MDLSAENILTIPESAPERLFSADGKTARRQFRTLAFRWHPDRCKDPKARDVFERVRRLYDAARAKQKKSAPDAGEILLTDIDGRKFRLRYRMKSKFELGETYVGRNSVAWKIDDEHRDLFEAAGNTIPSLPFADDKMRREMMQYLPAVRKIISGPDGLYLICSKQPDEIPLSRILDIKNGKISPEHVAWIVNGALNIACYLDHAGIVHHDIGPDTLFVSPRRHSVSLMGGWWYAVKRGERPLAVPGRTAGVMPSDLLSSKTAGVRTDLECIRLVGRELLGDGTGMRLARDASIPERMSAWLRQAGSGRAIDDYSAWKAVLNKSFGESRFIPFDVDIDDILTSKGDA